MNLYVIIFNLLLLTYSIFHFIRTIKFYKWVKKDKNIKKTFVAKSSNLIILIPCLNEQKVIKETIQHFNKIINSSFRIPIFLITTEKEKNVMNKKTTKEIIENDIIPYCNNVNLIHYPYKNGNMADQLNYAINMLKQNCNNFSNTYVSVYNADSRPNKNTFFEFYNVVKLKNYPKIIQQYSYCFSNIDELSFILKGFAVYQSNFELKIGLLNSYFNNLLHKHVVGHGLFIRLDLLDKINGFNSKYWCEDIYLSAYLQNEKITITPLLTLENMETANGILNLIKQNGVWFKTSSQCFKIYRELNKNKKLSISGKISFVNELRSCINWLMFPIIFLVAVLFSILLKNCILFFITISNYFLYIFIYYVTTIKIINLLDNKNYKFKFSIYIGTLIATMISNLGPLYTIFVNPKEKHKTER